MVLRPLADFNLDGSSEQFTSVPGQAKLHVSAGEPARAISQFRTGRPGAGKRGGAHNTSSIIRMGLGEKSVSRLFNPNRVDKANPW